MTLRECRLKKGLTQEQLADLSEVDQATISFLETAADPNPTWRTALRLATALKVKPQDIFPAVDIDNGKAASR